MKHIFISLLLLVSVGCYGQTEGSLMTTWIGSGAVDTTIKGFSTYNGPQNKRYDTTLSVVMLVFDSDIGARNTMLFFNDLNHAQNEGMMPYCMYGYEVRERFCCVNGYNGIYAVYQPIDYFNHIKYLDRDKKSLKSSIIVWMAIPLNKN